MDAIEGWVTTERKRLAMELVAKRFNELSLDEYHELLKLRCAVFSWSSSPYQEVDDADKGGPSTCTSATMRGALAAYARMLPAGVTHPTASIGRVIAVERGCGMGRRIMEEAIRVAQQELNADVITLSRPRPTPRASTRGWGFVRTSDEFDDGGIMHVEMKLTR